MMNQGDQNAVQEKKYSEKLKMFKVNILSHDGDKVNVKIPLMFAKIALKAKKKLSLGNDKVEDAFEAVDFEALIHMIDNNEIGELVNIESSNGDIIRIIIE